MSTDLKNFYTLSDFYNFIKKQENTPVSHKHNSVVLYPNYQTKEVPTRGCTYCRKKTINIK